jgi:hypothetical protein
MSKKSKPTKFEKTFNQGYICAITTMIKSHGINTPIVDAWNCNALTKEQLVTFEIDESDVEVLELHWNELNRIPSYQ